MRQRYGAYLDKSLWHHADFAHLKFVAATQKRDDDSEQDGETAPK